MPHRPGLLLIHTAARAGLVLWLAAAAGLSQAADAADDIRWLDRMTWGATPAALAELQQIGRAAWLEAQLRAPATDRVPAPIAARIDAMGISTESTRDRIATVEALRPPPRPAVAASGSASEAGMAMMAPDPAAAEAAQKAYQQSLQRPAVEARTRAVLRAVYSPDQLREQMVWFWMNHFSIDGRVGMNQAWLPDYEQRAIRPQALGRFRDLLEAVVTHPAMLLYLNNNANAVGKVNENLARELMELHTLGVDGGYTQADVQSLARVLTGLGVDVKNGLLPAAERPSPAGRVQRVDGFTVFAPARHDTSEKTLLGQPLPGPGWREIEATLDLLARHPATAHHVSQQLARHFVSDVPPPALVERMAKRFLATDGNIPEVLRVMFTSPEFEASLDQRFKMPVQYLLSSVRLLWPDPARAPDMARVLAAMERLGQPLYGRSTPDGYPPDSAYWNGSGQLDGRFLVARQLASAALAPVAPAAAPATAAGPGVASAGMGMGMGPAPAAAAPVSPAAAPGAAGALPEVERWSLDLLGPTLSKRTREALDSSPTPRERLTLLLASPEFMTR